MPGQGSVARSAATASPKYPLVLKYLCVFAAFHHHGTQPSQASTWGGDGAKSPPGGWKS